MEGAEIRLTRCARLLIPLMLLIGAPQVCPLLAQGPDQVTIDCMFDDGADRVAAVASLPCGVPGRPGEINVRLEIDRVELCTPALTA